MKGFNKKLIGMAGLLAVALPVSADIVTGAGENRGPRINVFSGRDAEPIADFNAFTRGFRGGVRVATGDVNGDGTPDIIVGAGPGVRGGHVRVFDGLSNTMMLDIHPFEFDPGFTGGVYVAAGDVTGDGNDEVIIAAGRGGGPHVVVFDANDGAELNSFLAYDATFSGGVRVATGDVDSDGFADIITSPGPGSDGLVKVFGYSGAISDYGLQPYGAGYRGGVFVAAGDINGDGFDDIITSPDAGGGPHVRVFDVRAGTMLNSFYAYNPGFLGGVRVAVGDVNSDEVPDIITGPGPGGGPHVRVFDGVDGSMINEFMTDPRDDAGVFVAASCDPDQCANSTDDGIGH